MGTNYAQHVVAPVPQTQALPNKAQVENSAGGFVFSVGPWARLDRFLILGNEGGTYYASEKQLTIENAAAAKACLAEDGERVVARLVEISVAGRAPKNNPALFVLALASGHESLAVRAAAAQALSQVARIPTHLFQFLDYRQAFYGWGRKWKRAVADWYGSKSPDQLAYQMIKYRSRGGWSHKDALRLAKPVRHSAEHQALYRWATRDEVQEHAPRLLHTWVRAQACKTPGAAAALVAAESGLTHEMFPTEVLGAPDVWRALLPSMPLTALIRNLGRMTANGTLAPLSAELRVIEDKLGSQEYLQKSRVHPMAVLVALKTYAMGHGEAGKLTWSAQPRVTAALDAAFRLAFVNVEPTGKRFFLGIDVSGSMTWGNIAGMAGVQPRDAAACLALVTAAKERDHHFFGFGERFVPLPISPSMSLADVCRVTDNLPFQRTDCALPMLYATAQKIPVDCFVVLTDNETFHGDTHPCVALEAYRQKMGIAAKLVVVGMTATDFSIADPSDVGSLDVVGMDTATPALIADFSR